jgi:hypothetical protein
MVKAAGAACWKSVHTTPPLFPKWQVVIQKDSKRERGVLWCYAGKCKKKTHAERRDGVV